MRSPFLPLLLAVVIAAPAAAQPVADTDQATPAPQKVDRETPRAVTQVAPQPSPASLRLKSNVQIELTITDQIGKGPSERKTVSMIAASGTWGKIRASGVARPSASTGWVPVGLNVDARPFVFPDGLVQIELTIGYNPLGPQPESTNNAPGMRPTELNQSMTVSLTDGKSLTVSQAADPVSDRKIIVEVKATILK